MTEIEAKTSGDLIIGSGVTFTGALSVPGRAVIGGQVNGEVNAAEVEITSTGVMTGVTTANNVYVRGEINKEVNCRDLLSIDSTGRAAGNINYGQLEITTGGSLSGSINSKKRD